MALLFSRRPLHSALQKHLETIGYESIYRQLIPDLGQPRASGWIAHKTPFPYCNDERASFAVNVITGLWTADDSESKAVGIHTGNILDCVALLFCDIDINGKIAPNWDRAERHLRHISGFASRREEMWFQQCYLALRDPACPIRANIQLRKPWNLAKLGDLPIGYDAEADAIVFGYYEQPDKQGNRGSFITAKLYYINPNRTHKAEWKDENAMVGNMPWPWNIYKESGTLVLCEGEPDAVTLWTHGIPAATGSAGASHFVPPGTWATTGGRQRNTVIAVADKDAAGRAAIEKSVNLLRSLRVRAGQLEMPDYEGQPGNADVSDYIKYRYACGLSRQDIVRELFSLIENATIDSGIISPAEMEAEDTDFLDIVTGKFLRRKFRAKVRIASLIRRPGVQAASIVLDCPGPTREAKCLSCIGKTEGKVINIVSNSRGALKLQRVKNNTNLRRVLGSEYGINPNCWQANVDLVPRYDIYDVVLVQPSSVFGLELGAMTTSIVAQLQLTHNQAIPDTGRDYIVEGFVEKPDDIAHIIVHLTSIELAAEEAEIVKAREGLEKKMDYDCEDAFNLLMYVCEDLSSSVTGIVGRPDMHAMMLLSFFAQSDYNFEGKSYDDGTLDLFIVGDTRTGKSEALKRLINWFQAGMVVDMKSATIPGLLGSVGHIGTSQEWSITPGILPLLDKTGGPCVLDEFKADHGHVMQALALMRSDSRVRISKAASQEVPARVSLIVLANPQIGKMINESGKLGVEFLFRLLKEPEDISRIDAAMCVTQGDVSISAIAEKPTLSPGRYNQVDWLKLHYWSKTRTADDIVITEEFTREVREAGKSLAGMYEPDVPLVLAADTTMKLVRLSMAIAKLAQHVIDGKVVINTDHLLAAVRLLTVWYNKPVFGFDVFSTNIKRARTIANVDEVKNTLIECYGDYIGTVIDNILMRGAINDGAFYRLAPASVSSVRRLIQILTVNRCMVDGKYNTYIMTSSFIELLREMRSQL